MVVRLSTKGPYSSSVSVGPTVGPSSGGSRVGPSPEAIAAAIASQEEEEVTPLGYGPVGPVGPPTPVPPPPGFRIEPRISPSVQEPGPTLPLLSPVEVVPSPPVEEGPLALPPSGIGYGPVGPIGPPPPPPSVEKFGATTLQERIQQDVSAGADLLDPESTFAHDVWVNMAVEGATVKELLDYLDKHPGAARGAYASTLRDELYEALGETAGLTGEALFKQHIEFGFIPEGSKYVIPKGEGQRAQVAAGEVFYLTPEQVKGQVASLKREGEVEKALGEFEPYKVDGGYDLVAALQAGLPPIVFGVAGFSGEDVTQARAYIASTKAEVVKVEIPSPEVVLAGFKVDGGYDLVGAIRGGVTPKVLVSMGFEAKGVLDAQIAAAGVVTEQRAAATLEPY
ncbi:hypothetical protein LCGC14_2254060, partial [marine sediment metagenome]